MSSPYVLHVYMYIERDTYQTFQFLVGVFSQMKVIIAFEEAREFAVRTLKTLLHLLAVNVHSVTSHHVTLQAIIVLHPELYNNQYKTGSRCITGAYMYMCKQNAQPMTE